MSTAKTGGRAKIPKWCRHIRIINDPYWGEYLSTDKEGWIDWVTVTHRWKFCPICGKPRPKTGGIER